MSESTERGTKSSDGRRSGRSDASVSGTGIPEQPSASRQSVIKVLLIDDDELQHLIIEKFLNTITNTKYDLTCVSNYEAAMEQINKNTEDYSPYDVYLVDYDLGSHKGTTIIQEAID